MKAIPIRIRLSLWYFAIFATAACLLSLASWWMLRRSVDSTELHDLEERVQDVQLLLAHRNPNGSIDDLRREFASIYSIKDDGKWLQVMDAQGNWIYRSRRMIAENPVLDPPDRLPTHGVLTEFHQGTRYVRVLAAPILAGGNRYSVQTGIALNKSLVLLATFGTDLLLLTPATILLAAIGGHWMSRKALRPVAILAMEARRINDRNLDIRLPVSNAEDELSDLSRTLNQMLQRIDEAFASVRAFTGNASHELRTPIALLRTEIELTLYRHRDGDEYRAALKRLQEETIRMTDLVENLLSLARADGGAEVMTRVPIPVKELFHRVETPWRKTMQAAMIDFHVEVEPDLVLAGDFEGLSRLLSILLENAAKFTPPGGSVSLSATSAGDTVILAVRDTGIGISPADIPRIFDRFYRAAHSSVPAPRGSGLGLALAKWIAERHDARLTVESSPGRGSCFSFALAKVAGFSPEQILASASTTHQPSK